jgi:hypothetical protein
MVAGFADENAFTFLLRACRVPVRHRRGRPPCLPILGGQPQGVAPTGRPACKTKPILRRVSSLKCQVSSAKWTGPGIKPSPSTQPAGRAKQSQLPAGTTEANCRSRKGLREKVRAMRLRKQSQFVRSGLQYARKGICRGGPLCPPWATTGRCPYKEARVQNKANFRRPGPMRDRSATKGSQMGQTDGVAMPRRSHACPTLGAKSAIECRPHPLVIRWEPLC